MDGSNKHTVNREQLIHLLLRTDGKLLEYVSVRFTVLKLDSFSFREPLGNDLIDLIEHRVDVAFENPIQHLSVLLFGFGDHV